MRCAALLASRIIARVYSATGATLAAAAVETMMPRSQQAGVTWPLTPPPAWTIARSAGAAARTASSTGGHPQPLRITSARSRRGCVDGGCRSLRTTSRSTRARAASRARPAGEKSRCGRFGSIARTVSGLDTGGLLHQRRQRMRLAGDQRRVVGRHELEQRVDRPSGLGEACERMPPEVVAGGEVLPLLAGPP